MTNKELGQAGSAPQEPAGGAKQYRRREMPWGQLPRPSRDGYEEPNGLVVVDKMQGVTSHDVVGAMRALAGTRKVGHAGTLDPMATGVLCVGVGRATKLLQYVTGTSKEYVATIRLGLETTTEDAEGAITRVLGCGSLTNVFEDDGKRLATADEIAARIEAAIAPLRGDILQVPSAVSAIKVGGKRSYDLVRSGAQVQLEARPVRIGRFEALGLPSSTRVEAHGEWVDVLDLEVIVECSAGTYIRALARDLGDSLHTGAHLIALRRTRVGSWTVNHAFSIPALAEYVAAGEPLPMVSLADLCRGLFPCIEVSGEEAALLRNGQSIEKRPWPAAPAGCAPGEVAVAFSDCVPVALISRRSGKLKPDLLLSL